MNILRSGNSLAVCSPDKLVRELGLREGDRIDLIRDSNAVRVRRLPIRSSTRVSTGCARCPPEACSS